ncbi:MAG: hypothetical protein ACRENL_06975 [Candidatus Dormibacteria bacterium]
MPSAPSFDDPALCKRLSEAALLRSRERFSWEATARTSADVYGEVVSALAVPFEEIAAAVKAAIHPDDLAEDEDVHPDRVAADERPAPEDPAGS